MSATALTAPFDTGDQARGRNAQRVAEAEQGVESGRLLIVLQLAE
jgi:hypothetical protein